MRLLRAAVVAAVLLGGCGGSDSDDGDTSGGRPTATQSRPAPDDFVRRVDALCRSTRPELLGIRTSLTRARDAARAGRTSLPETFASFARLLRRAGAITERFEARLRSIEPPPGERAFRGRLLRSVQQGGANVREQVRAAEAQDALRLRRLSVQGSVIDAKQKGLLAGHGGFRSCGMG